MEHAETAKTDAQPEMDERLNQIGAKDRRKSYYEECVTFGECRSPMNMTMPCSTRASSWRQWPRRTTSEMPIPSSRGRERVSVLLRGLRNTPSHPQNVSLPDTTATLSPIVDAYSQRPVAGKKEDQLVRPAQWRTTHGCGGSAEHDLDSSDQSSASAIPRS